LSGVTAPHQRCYTTTEQGGNKLLAPAAHVGHHFQTIEDVAQYARLSNISEQSMCQTPSERTKGQTDTCSLCSFAGVHRFLTFFWFNLSREISRYQS